MVYVASMGTEADNVDTDELVFSSMCKQIVRELF